MYKKLIPAVLTLAVFVFAQAPMTNEDVIRMARQGVSNAAIVEAINTAKAQDFRVTPQDQPALEAASVPQLVIIAMMQRVMKDGARSSARSDEPKPAPVVSKPINAADPASATPVRQPHFRNSGEWALERGRPEFAARAGATTFINGGTTTSYSGGLGGGVGLTKNVAAVGEYTYNHLGSGTLYGVSASARVHDVLGSVRISTSGRVAPYVIGGGGMSNIGGSASAFGFRILSGSVTKPALAFGGGINGSITSHVGVQFDVRGIRPKDSIWYARASGGLFFRF